MKRNPAMIGLTIPIYKLNRDGKTIARYRHKANAEAELKVSMEADTEHKYTWSIVRATVIGR